MNETDSSCCNIQPIHCLKLQTFEMIPQLAKTCFGFKNCFISLSLCASAMSELISHNECAYIGKVFAIVMMASSKVEEKVPISGMIIP